MHDCNNNTGCGNPGRRRRGRVAIGVSLFLALLFVQLAQIAPAAEEYLSSGHYQLGRGYRLPALGVSLGGYASVKYIDLEARQPFTEISDLSLFLGWDNGARWRAFSELEIGEALVYHDGEPTSDESEFELERAYVDYLHADWLTVRLGKALAPIGHWNSIHADPLIWTVSRPLTTDTGFYHYISGLSLLGSIPGERGVWEYQAYVDNSARLDPRPDNRYPPGEVIPGLEIGPFDHAVGARLVYRPDSESWQFGLSLARFGIEHYAGVKHLLGLDFQWRLAGVSLSGEALYRSDSNEDAGEVGGVFLQAVVPMSFAPRWYFVSRAERFRDETVSARADTLSLGLAWRPLPPVVFKLEGRQGRGNDTLAPDGIFSSLAILF